MPRSHKETQESPLFTANLNLSTTWWKIHCGGRC